MWKRVFPQPVIGLTIVTFAMAAIISAWYFLWLGCAATACAMPAWEWATTSIWAVSLFVAIVVAFQYPIHVRINIKAYMGTVPLYLTAVLLPPPLAAMVAGLATLWGDMLGREQRGLQAIDMMTAAARYALVVLISATVIHLPVPLFWRPVELTGGALIFWMLDVVSVPLLLGPIVNEPPLRIMRNVVTGSWQEEGTQLLLGVLGALLTIRHGWALVLLFVPCWVVYTAFKNLKETQIGTRTMLETMADIVDLRDPYTGGHSRRVAEVTRAILDQMAITGAEADLIVAAARVHDIGKIGVPDNVLNKRGALSPDERIVMQSHAARGSDVLERYPDFKRGAAIVRHHHENWDGTGYPDRYKNTDIPFGARVIAVADSYDAMTSDRPYRSGMPRHRAAMVLAEGSNSQWDSEIVAAFLKTIDVDPIAVPTPKPLLVLTLPRSVPPQILFAMAENGETARGTTDA